MKKFINGLAILLGGLLIISALSTLVIDGITDSFLETGVMVLIVGILLVIPIKGILKIVAIIVVFTVNTMIMSSSNAKYFNEHSAEIIKQVETKYAEGNYTTAMKMINKYSLSKNQKLIEIERKIDEIESERKAKKRWVEEEKEAEIAKIAEQKQKENEARAIEEAIQRTYSTGALPRSFPTSRQCTMVRSMDTTGEHIIKRNDALRQNYIIDLSVIDESIKVYTRWKDKTYDAFYKKPKMSGMSKEGASFVRYYSSITGLVKITIWIDSSGHYVQIHDSFIDPIVYLFRCTDSKGNRY